MEVEEDDSDLGLEELQEQLHDLKQLVESRGWKLLNRWIDAQKANRLPGIYRQPLHSHDAVFEQEFAKGEIAGLELFQQVPYVEIEKYESALAGEQALTEEEVEYDEDF